MATVLCYPRDTYTHRKGQAMFWRKKRQEAEQTPPNRGWILFWSVLLEALMLGGGIAVICLSSAFLLGRGPTPTALALLLDALGVFAVILTPVVGFLLVYFWWAPNNLFWTFVPEGRAKVVVRGDAVGRVLIQLRDHAQVSADAAYPSLRPDETTDPPRREGDIVGCPTKKRFWGGLRFYGFWPINDLYVYRFKWTNMAHDGRPQPHDEEMDHVLIVDDVYWAEVRAAEDQALLPLDVGLVLRLRVINPYKALFRVENWLEVVINMVEPSVRDVLSKKTYEEWISQDADLGEEIWERLQEDEEEDLVGLLRERYGVEFISLGVKSFDPTPLGELNETRKATLKQYLAEKEATRIQTEAKGRKEEARLLGEGAAAGIKAVQELGSDAMQLRAMETLAASKGTAMVVLGKDGPPVIINPPSSTGRQDGGNKKKGGQEGEVEG